MGIIIQNMSGEDFGNDVINKYQVRINTKVIAEFEHWRKDGLAECLRKAADAVEDPNRVEVINDRELLKFMLDISTN